MRSYEIRKNKQIEFSHSQLNNVIFYAIKVDLFYAGQFDLRQTAAFHLQQTAVFVDATANAFLRAIVMIDFDIFRKYKAYTGTDQQ